MGVLTAIYTPRVIESLEHSNKPFNIGHLKIKILRCRGKHRKNRPAR
jgi:hypothetical protein